MRLIDANELMEHVWRDKLDSRELIANMVSNAPTVKEIPTKIPINVFERLILQESILDKIRAEISCNIVEDDTSENIPAQVRADWAAANKAHMIDIAIIDKYRTKSAVGQEPKTGHWIDIDEKSAVCSCCYRNNTLYGDYCKWCGAKMVNPQESEEV